MVPEVVLINPKMCRPSGVRLPLSVLALGAALEGRYEYRIIDGNIDPDAVKNAVTAVSEGCCRAVGITVMPGPQVAPAIEISAAIKAANPSVPIIWGGYFPTLYPGAAINAPYVDYVIRGEGEAALLNLLEGDDPGAVQGLTWKDHGQPIHNPNSGFRSPDEHPMLPYEKVGDVRRYLRRSFMGSRTAVHQAAVGCRYRCTFCGVVSMFNGFTALSSEDRLDRSLRHLRDTYGADSIQFYDHNFFDNEKSSLPTIDVLAELKMPWWCYARADTLAKFSTSTWDQLRRSRFTMAYIGAEAASDEVLKRMRKGSKVEHTFEVARRCREYGVIPEFSFVLGGPEDPEGEIERTFQFVRKLKAIHPQCEVVLYFYSPTPQRDPAYRKSGRPEAVLPVLNSYGPSGPELPSTPEEWTQPEWLNYVCHQDAPWLSSRMRQRVRDFGNVLGCRFPTVQDYATPAWGKRVLSALASWRYAAKYYTHPVELNIARKFIPLRRPQVESL
ncbi:MAG TPA: radical SAM protein [Bryobacteraceae bacterium]|nr:radical SAM protein [Bryobacteraceae bacterium]